MTSGGGEFFLLLPSLFFSREVFANFHADAVWVRWAWERTRRKLSTGNVENSENRFPLSLLSAMKNYSSDWKLGERMNSLSTFSRGRERAFHSEVWISTTSLFFGYDVVAAAVELKKKKEKFLLISKEKPHVEIEIHRKAKGTAVHAVCFSFQKTFHLCFVHFIFIIFLVFSHRNI